MRIDLHSHTRASDGTQTAEELLRAAAEQGIDVLGLTDHDTAEAWDEAARAAAEVGHGPPLAKVRIAVHPIELWPVLTSGAEFDRSVFAGEADGRWLWLVLRPASAMLLLRDDWILRDVSGIGPPLLEMPFGGPRPVW